MRHKDRWAALEEYISVRASRLLREVHPPRRPCGPYELLGPPRWQKVKVHWLDGKGIRSPLKETHTPVSSGKTGCLMCRYGRRLRFSAQGPGRSTV